jgi:peptidoglycan/xylan/chitin deacetylase (PgdA/CDA1 family)
MLVRARTLARQLDWVARRFRIVSLDELGEHLQSGGPPPRPLAAVTFDDGYRDVYEHAFPMLKRKGIPAAVFVVTDLMGTSHLQTHDRLFLGLAHLFGQPGGRGRLVGWLDELGLRPMVFAGRSGADGLDAFSAMRAVLEALTSAQVQLVLQALDREGGPEEADFPELRPLTWEMVGEMHQAGMTIGSHTRSHALLTQESPERVRDEVLGSRLELEQRLGDPVRHFAYPDGRFNAAVVEQVASAGYRFAYTTCQHRDRRHLLTVPRRLLWENASQGVTADFSPAVMGCLAGGVFDLATRCGPRHGARQHGYSWPTPTV